MTNSISEKMKIQRRIYVECAFGEIDRRWVFFWKPLEGSLKGHQYTIDAALRLHNFIVNYREEELNRGEDEDDYENEEEWLNQASDYFLRSNPLNLLGTTSEGSGRGSEGESEGR